MILFLVGQHINYVIAKSVFNLNAWLYINLFTVNTVTTVAFVHTCHYSGGPHNDGDH
jgi:hypothetical protein